MPRKLLMTWDEDSLRWKKQYKLQPYEVYCSQLDLPEELWTKLGSYQAANEWWIRKKAEIDSTSGRKPLSPEAQSLVDELEIRKAILAREGKNVQPYTELIAEVDSSDTSHVDPMAQRRAELLGTLGVDLSGLDPRTLNLALGATEYFEEKLAEQRSVQQSRKIGVKLDDWYSLIEQGAKPSSLISVKGYIKVFKDLWHKGKAILAAEMAIDEINADKVEKVFHAVGARELDNGSKRKMYSHFKSFVRYLVELELIPMPANIASRRLSFKVAKRSKSLPDVTEITSFIEKLPRRLQLYAMLALNTSMNNVDIGALRHNQINWKTQKLRRKRVKTGDDERVPTVTYKLWDATARLLREEMSEQGEFVLTEEDGSPVYVSEIRDSKPYLYDKIKTRWRDHFKSDKAAKKFTMKDFRFFGADLLKADKPWRPYRQVFLGHAPSEIVDVNYSSDEDITNVCEHLESLLFPKKRPEPK